MKKTTSSRVLATAIALALSAPLAAADRLHAGEWEFTTSHADGEPNVFKHCITADEATSVNGDSKSARAYAEKKSSNCKIMDYRVAGDSVSFAMTCGTTSIRSTATYHGDTSEGELVSKNGSGPEVVSRVKARRIGDCP